MLWWCCWVLASSIGRMYLLMLMTAGSFLHVKDQIHPKKNSIAATLTYMVKFIFLKSTTRIFQLSLSLCLSRKLHPWTNWFRTKLTRFSISMVSKTIDLASTGIKAYPNTITQYRQQEWEWYHVCSLWFWSMDYYYHILVTWAMPLMIFLINLRSYPIRLELLHPHHL